MADIYQRKVENLNIDFMLKLFGTLDGNADILEKAFNVRISISEGELSISGESENNVAMAYEAVYQLEKLSRLQDAIEENTVNYVISMIRENRSDELSVMYDDCICLTNKGKPIKAKTVGQQKYVEAIKKNTVTFGVGPAGTGKTFLAVAMAVTALKQKQISRIILTRPAVEAGEKLGFLPGDLQQKINPYLRPLYDALGEMLGHESFTRFMEKNIIEIAPLPICGDAPLTIPLLSLTGTEHHPEQMKCFNPPWKQFKAIVHDITIDFIYKSGMIGLLAFLTI